MNCGSSQGPVVEFVEAVKCAVGTDAVTAALTRFQPSTATSTDCWTPLSPATRLLKAAPGSVDSHDASNRSECLESALEPHWRQVSRRGTVCGGRREGRARPPLPPDNLNFLSTPFRIVACVFGVQRRGYGTLWRHLPHSSVCFSRVSGNVLCELCSCACRQPMEWFRARDGAATCRCSISLFRGCFRRVF